MMFRNNLGVGIKLKCMEEGITLAHSALRSWGDVMCMNNLVNSEKRKIVVKNAIRRAWTALGVPPYDPKDWVFSIYSDMMLRLLWMRCGWEDDYTYLVCSTLHSEYSLVEFDLGDVEQVNESQVVQGESGEL
ncbi:MAG: hypothetical protein LUI06_01350 [Ruminococcus sp.]|nr:hypothetical protein [Ruminococcus sp.]